MYLSKFFKIIGLICLTLALILLFQRNNPKRVAFKSTPNKLVVNRRENSAAPVRIRIKKQNIDLAIIPAKVYGQKWETTSQGVSWLDISPLPGDIGNSIIYGHNWSNLLGRLIYVKPGDEIKINYTDGTSKKFIVNNTAMVSPDNVSVLSQSDEKMITIYTCAGLFDEKRFVVVGTLLQEVSKR